MMWLTLPPMKNYWHEPTCQQYNHEWCAEEKGHSWGPRHYVEEQLSSLAPWLRCSNSVLKTRRLTHSYRIFFNHVASVAICHIVCHHIKINMRFQLRWWWQQKVINFIPSPSRLKNCTLLWKWMTDHPACGCGGKAGEGLHRKCGTAWLPFFVIAQPSDAIYLFLLPTTPCRFSTTGAVWELLSSAWAKYMHNSWLSVAQAEITEIQYKDRNGLNGLPVILIISNLSAPALELPLHIWYIVLC